MEISMPKKIDGNNNYPNSSLNYFKEVVIYTPPKYGRENCLICNLSVLSNKNDASTGGTNTLIKGKNKRYTELLEELEKLIKSFEDNSPVLRDKMIFFRKETANELKKNDN